MSSPSVPLISMVDRLLIRAEFEQRTKRTAVTKTKAHRLVTRELLHPTPSHGVPQGSSVFPQVGGVFCHCIISDSSAAAAGGGRTASYKSEGAKTRHPPSLQEISNQFPELSF